MGSSGFVHLDFLQCCKFAEGDSRVLMLKMARWVPPVHSCMHACTRTHTRCSRWRGGCPPYTHACMHAHAHIPDAQDGAVAPAPSPPRPRTHPSRCIECTLYHVPCTLYHVPCTLPTGLAERTEPCALPRATLLSITSLSRLAATACAGLPRRSKQLVALSGGRRLSTKCARRSPPPSHLQRVIGRWRRSCGMRTGAPSMSWLRY